MTNKILRIPKFVARFYPRRIWYGPSQDFFLTFDDGPHPEITPKLLELLRAENIKASFFWQGDQLEKHPEYVEVALKDGHTIGHHGYHHISNKTLSFDKFQLNFQKSKTLVPHDLYRPPKGIITKKQAQFVLKSNQLVMWSYLSYDWDPTFTVKDVITNFKKGLGKGDVSVFHENDKTRDRIFEIIPEVIRTVRKKGLNFAPLPKK